MQQIFFVLIFFVSLTAQANSNTDSILIIQKNAATAIESLQHQTNFLASQLSFANTQVKRKLAEVQQSQVSVYDTADYQAKLASTFYAESLRVVILERSLLHQRHIYQVLVDLFQKAASNNLPRSSQAKAVMQPFDHLLLTIESQRSHLEGLLTRGSFNNINTLRPIFRAYDMAKFRVTPIAIEKLTEKHRSTHRDDALMDKVFELNARLNSLNATLLANRSYAQWLTNNMPVLEDLSTVAQGYAK